MTACSSIKTCTPRCVTKEGLLVKLCKCGRPAYDENGDIVEQEYVKPIVVNYNYRLRYNKQDASALQYIEVIIYDLECDDLDFVNDDLEFVDENTSCYSVINNSVVNIGAGRIRFNATSKQHIKAFKA